ncbi:MAG TPA: hypothetical protein VGO60_14280 [Iamia sp.]|nr:hypothetical protein [Iamia sp.]
MVAAATPSAAAPLDRGPGRVDRAGPRRRRSARRDLVVAALAVAASAVGALTIGTLPVLHRPTPSTAVPPAHAASIAPGRAAGALVEAETPVAPVADGQVVAGLVDPTATLLATPGAAAPSSPVRRLGTLAALAVEERRTG